MTSIFAYPLKNAWILVSDRLETNQTEVQRSDSEDETYPYDVITKIKKNKRYVYGLAGESKDIQKITDLLESNINQKFDFNQFVIELKKLYGNTLSSLNVELLLIDSNLLKAYKIVMNSLPNNIAEVEIFSIEKGYIGSGANRSRAKYHTTPMFESLKSLDIQDLDVRQLLIKSVTGLEILAKNDYQFTGHPAIYGTNIIVITKSKIFDYKILPKRYIFKESMQENWLELEELKND